MTGELKEEVPELGNEETYQIGDNLGNGPEYVAPVDPDAGKTPDTSVPVELEEVRAEATADAVIESANVQAIQKAAEALARKEEIAAAVVAALAEQKSTLLAEAQATAAAIIEAAEDEARETIIEAHRLAQASAPQAGVNWCIPAPPPKELFLQSAAEMAKAKKAKLKKAVSKEERAALSAKLGPSPACHRLMRKMMPAKHLRKGIRGVN